MQRLPPEGGYGELNRFRQARHAPATPSINRIAQQWVPLFAEMDADLVGAAGGKTAFDQRYLALEGL